jgi:hypothetical protein
MMFSQKNWSHFKIIFQKANVNKFIMYFSLVSPLVLASFVETQVEGGRLKMTSEGKGKPKEKVIEPPSFDTFMEVLLSESL